jgi:hypothetical protein
VAVLKEKVGVGSEHDNLVSGSAYLAGLLHSLGP